MGGVASLGRAGGGDEMLPSMKASGGEPFGACPRRSYGRLESGGGVGANGVSDELSVFRGGNGGGAGISLWAFGINEGLAEGTRALKGDAFDLGGELM